MGTSSFPFRRDAFTWLAYFMLGYFAYAQAVLGPAIPFLREELNLNYTIAGFHATALALGMILAGLTSDNLTIRYGRKTLFWFGGGGMAIGIITLAISTHAILTILSTFIMGWLGTFLLITIQSTLTDHHGEQRAIALTEANTVAIIFATLTPFAIGFSEGIGLGWTFALLIVVVFWVITYLGFRNTAVPQPPKQKTESTHHPTDNLPTNFWIMGIIIFLTVAIEWSMVFWGADYLENAVGYPPETAATLMSVYFIAAVIGRTMNSRLTRRFESTRLLLWMVIIFTLGFIPFWLADTPLINVIGLFFVGFGIGSTFPLGIATATSIAPALADKASARISFTTGLAILIAPQTLGTIADQIGIQGAYIIVLVMVIIVIVLLTIMQKRLQRSTDSP